VTSGGSLGTPLVIQTGNAPDTTGRYGDYFAVSIDPNGTTGWVAGEVGGHNSVGGWGTAAA
jgi:hypothetical protein